MAQGLGFPAFTAEGQDSIPGWETKILQTTWHGQKIKISISSCANSLRPLWDSRIWWTVKNSGSLGTNFFSCEFVFIGIRRMDWEISPWAKAHLGNVHSNLSGTAFGTLFWSCCSCCQMPSGPLLLSTKILKQIHDQHGRTAWGRQEIHKCSLELGVISFVCK